jgi:hypothetical protein
VVKESKPPRKRKLPGDEKVDGNKKPKDTAPGGLKLELSDALKRMQAKRAEAFGSISSAQQQQWSHSQSTPPTTTINTLVVAPPESDRQGEVHLPPQPLDSQSALSMNSSHEELQDMQTDSFVATAAPASSVSNQQLSVQQDGSVLQSSVAPEEHFASQ